jgi:hypothetical protein
MLEAGDDGPAMMAKGLRATIEIMVKSLTAS